jgi:tripartite-type tricarboxylate transporter receptor subunit TctC
VRIVVGYPAGFSPDIIARLVSQGLSERLRQSFIIENRPGAGTNIAAETVIRAAPDGYTLLATTAATAVNETLYPIANFDLIRDIVPVAGCVRYASVLVVTPSLPAQTVPELIAFARANPGKVYAASPGIGTLAHVSAELFNLMAGADLVHVPYRGNLFPDVLSGQIQVTFAPPASAMGYVRAGQLRALAVTSGTRLDALPEVPALSEFVPGYEASGWEGIGAPRNTPTAIIEVLNEAITAAMADPGMKARLADLGLEPMTMTPAEFGSFVADEIGKWAKVIKAANIKPE